MSKESSLLKLKNVSKFYYSKGMVASGFSKVNLEFNLGEFVVITGESGLPFAVRLVISTTSQSVSAVT